MRCQLVARVHATKASPSFPAGAGPLQPSKETMHPSWAVMPCDLWMVSAHAKRSGTFARVNDSRVLCRTSAQGIGTQVFGRSSKQAGPLYSGKCTTTKSGTGQAAAPRGKAPSVELGHPVLAMPLPSVRLPPAAAYTMATTTPRAPFMSPRGTVGTSQMRFSVSITRAPTHKCSAPRT